MIVLAAIPPLWRRVMDHRLLEHYGGDVDAREHPPAQAPGGPGALRRERVLAPPATPR